MLPVHIFERHLPTCVQGTHHGVANPSASLKKTSQTCSHFMYFYIQEQKLRFLGLSHAFGTLF